MKKFVSICLMLFILSIFFLGCNEIPVDDINNHDIINLYINPKIYNYSVIETSQNSVTIDNIFGSGVFDKNGNIASYKLENSDSDFSYSLNAEMVSIDMTHNWIKLRKSVAGDYELTFKANITEHIETSLISRNNGPYEEREVVYTKAQETIITNIEPFNRFNLYSNKNEEIFHTHNDHNDYLNCEWNLRSLNKNIDGKFITTKVVSSFDYNEKLKGFIIKRLELILLENDEVMLMFYQYNVYTRYEYEQGLYQKLITDNEI